MPLTDFQKCLLALSAIKNQLENSLRVFKRYPADEDQKWGTSNHIIIMTCTFLEEWKRLRQIARQNDAQNQSVEIAQIAVDRINRWSGLQTLRNSLLAHPSRLKDKKRVAIPAELLENAPSHYAEILLLGECAVYATAVIIGRHQQEQIHALLSIPHPKIPDAGGIKTLEELETEISEIRRKIFLRDPSLENSFDSKKDINIGSLLIYFKHYYLQK